MNQMLPTSSIPQTMSSREIAELTGKAHKNVIRDIVLMIEAIEKDGSDLSHQAKSEGYVRHNDARGYTSSFDLDQDLTYNLVLGYDAALRLKVVRRWMELESGEAPAKVRSPRKSAVSSAFRQAYTIAKIAGLDDNQAALRAGQYCENKCGENPLPLMGLTYLEAPENERTLSPTEIADALGLPGKSRGAVGNNVLLAAGMQRFTYVKGRKTWTPTEKGEEFARLQDVSKAHCAGSTMIYRWSPKVLDVLRAHLGTSATPYGAVSATPDDDLLGGIK